MEPGAEWMREAVREKVAYIIATELVEEYSLKSKCYILIFCVLLLYYSNGQKKMSCAVRKLLLVLC